MKYSMQDKYKQQNSRFQLERQIAEDQLNEQDLANQDEDMDPPKNRFDALMRRIGWGTVVTLVILLIIIKLLWNML